MATCPNCGGKLKGEYCPNCGVTMDELIEGYDFNVMYGNMEDYKGIYDDSEDGEPYTE